MLATKNARAIDTRTDLDTFIVFGTATDGATTMTLAAAPITWPSSGSATVTVAATGGTPTGSVSLAVDGGASTVLPLVNGAYIPLAE